MTVRNRVFNTILLAFPKLRLIEALVETFVKTVKKTGKMKLPAKIGIGSGVTFILIVVLGFIALPHLLKSKIKSVSFRLLRKIRKIKNNSFLLEFNVKTRR